MVPTVGADPNEVIEVEEDTLKSLSADELIERSDLSCDDVDQADELASEDLKGRPAVTLTNYQKLIVTVTARFLAFQISRQGGKTFAACLRIARKVISNRLKYYIFSRSERQSANAVAQTAVHLRAMERALRAKGKRIGEDTTYSSQALKANKADGSSYKYSRLTVNLPNGSQVVGLPASPDTCVGISGAVYCDEFALHRDSRAIYSRLFPIVSRRREYEFLITSTPRGIGNKFYEIMTSDDFGEVFTRIIVDIFEAVAQGLRLYDYEGNLIEDDEGIEKLRKALKDPEAWKEEYLVQFIDDVMNLLTYEMIARCESAHNEDGDPYEILETPDDYDPNFQDLGKLVQPFLKGNDLFIGFDQARHRHLSVIWLDEEVDQQLWQRAKIIMHDKDFEFQEAALWQLMRLPKMRKAGIDATGLGERTAERTVTRFGGIAVAINFGSNIVDRNGNTHAAKALLARVIMERHQDATDHYPISDETRDDFHKVKRKRGNSPDSFTYFADDDATGHSDIFTAKALSDVVYQEMKEYGGRTDGMRVGKEQNPAVANRNRPDHSSDYQKDAGEFAGIGTTGY